MALKSSISGIREGQEVTVAGDLLERPFQSVSFHKTGKEIEVECRFLLPPTERWSTCLAVEASESVRPLWGRALTGDVPLPVQERYHQQGWVSEENRGGRLVRLYCAEACQDAVGRGLLKWTPNRIEPLVQGFLEFLAARVDDGEAPSLVYWGCRPGDTWVDLGRIPRAKCGKVSVPGGESFSFGASSRLLPLVEHLVARSSEVPRTLVVVLTDGRFADLEELQSYSSNLAVLIKGKAKNFLKFVAIGVGPDVQPEALVSLRGLDIAPNVNLWDFKLASDLENLQDILAGMVTDDQTVAPGAVIFDAKGRKAAEFKDGLPGKITFRLPLDSPMFSLQVAGQSAKVAQPLLNPLRKGDL
ncbi:MAG: hypothetical protein GX442_25550 [Candidatus Riflebacteria bacterium]|nr:hypothetical protein [Candidatus Riflebacteria bacterium]